MTSCLMSSMNELRLLRIDGAIEALDEAYRESLPKLLKSGRCESTAAAGFSVMGTAACGGGVELAADAGLLALK